MSRYLAALLALVLSVLNASTAAGFPTTAPADAAQITRWIAELDADRYQVREAATRHLLRAGHAAIDPLADAAARAGSHEVTTRAVRILKDFSHNADPALASNAMAALTKLASRREGTAARLARDALWSHRVKIIDQIRATGARVQLVDFEVVAIDFDEARCDEDVLRLLRKLPQLETLSLGNARFNDATLALLGDLPNLTRLNLFQSSVGDEGLKHLQGLTSLRSISLGETKVTDNGLVHLADLAELTYLGLRATKVTGAGLPHLQRLTKLHTLFLAETAMNDQGLEHVKAFANLKTLYLWDTKVSPEGIARLERALPDLKVTVKP